MADTAEVTEKPKYQIEVEYGPWFKCNGRNRRRILDVRCTCGNNLERKDGSPRFSHLADTILCRRVFGIVRGYLMVDGSYDINEEWDERLCCDECGAEIELDTAQEIEVDMTTDSSRGFERARALAGRGDSHTDCYCKESDLLEQHQIRWFSVSEPAFNQPNPNTADNTKKAKVQYDATPFVRGWFDSQMRLVVTCPHCDGSMLRKKADSVIEGNAAVENLARSA